LPRVGGALSARSRQYHGTAASMSNARQRTLGPVRAAVSTVLAGAICLFAPVPGTGMHQRTSTTRPPARIPDIFFVPTRQPIVDAMLKLARVTPDDVVYDLGSGDGRIVVIAAQKYGARAVGIELDPKLVAISREIARDSEVADRATFIEGDLFTADISAATVVTLYLSPSVNSRLETKLKQELRPGTRIVSHQFPIGRWTPAETARVDGAELLLWRVGS
jgi:SAM-dependent methyltransferase